MLHHLKIKRDYSSIVTVLEANNTLFILTLIPWPAECIVSSIHPLRFVSGIPYSYGIHSYVLIAVPLQPKYHLLWQRNVPPIYSFK